MGYHRAGFEVVGVDIKPQKNYPFEFHMEDALEYPLDGFDVVHASPPCQAFTLAQRINNYEHVNYIPELRELLLKCKIPYIIENVVGAPLKGAYLLCGQMFSGLKVYRHRIFESSIKLNIPYHGEHLFPLAKMGRPTKEYEFMHVVGHFSGVEKAKEAMGIDWMTRDELKEAIPPAYTEYIGRQLIEYLNKV